MIDRKRVRELATRKPFRVALIDFLARIDPEIERMERWDVELFVSADELDELDMLAWEAIGEFTAFDRLVSLRMRTRGHVSGEMNGLSKRLERAGRAVYFYLGQRQPKGGFVFGTENETGSQRRRLKRLEKRFGKLDVSIVGMRRFEGVRDDVDGAI
jgi:hypothetical protein